MKLQNSTRLTRAMKDLIRMRRLVWVFFWLLLLEGALRKWVFRGGVGNALLIARDPVVLALYFYAWRSNLFPRNILVFFAAVIALVTFVVGFVMTDANPFVVVFGARTNFLYIPLIFLLPKILERKQVDRLGYWILVISIPMSMIMVAQFVSPPSSFINATVGEGEQIRAAMGHVRPAGTFSFASGPTFFYSLVAVFLAYSQFSTGNYPVWLCILATLSSFVSVAVSSSRSLLVSLLIVCVFAFVHLILRLRFKVRWVFVSAGLTVGLLSLMTLPVMQKGILVFSARIAEADSIESDSGGIVSRALGNFTSVKYAIAEVPIFGYGLGKGTNVGAILLTGKAQFLSGFSETEWQRIVFESGPVIGGSFILYRIAITSWIALIVLPYAKQKNPLPFLLFGACFLGILNGQWAQSTNLGFVIFISGLCLAATKTTNPLENSDRRIKRLRATPMLPRYEKTQSAFGR